MVLHLGEVMGTFSALFFGVSNLIVRRGQVQTGQTGLVHTTLVNCLVFLLFNLLAGLYGMVRGKDFLAAITGGAGFVPVGLALFVAAGLLTTFTGRYFMFSAMRAIGPSRAASLKAVSPVVTAILAVAWLGEPYGLLQGVGTALAVVGLWVLSGEVVGHGHPQEADAAQGREREETGTVHAASRQGGGLAVEAVAETAARPRGLPRPVVGVLQGIASAAAFGVGHTLRKAALNVIPAPSLGALIGSLVAFVISYAGAAGRGQGATVLPRNRMALEAFKPLLLGGLLTSAGQLSNFFGLHYGRASLVTVLAMMDPLFTLALSRLVLGRLEVITARTVGGVLLTVAGAAMVVAA